MTVPSHQQDTLESIRSALSARAADILSTTAFCAQVRALPLPDALPPVFGRALGDLLDRMESSALFSGESCSFSETDLNAALQLWLEKAEARLLKF